MRNGLLSILIMLLGGLPLRAIAQTPNPLNPTKKVLIIGIDGLRPDALQKANTPNIDTLIENGCYSSQAKVGKNTVSGPGWSSMLTGVWSAKHGVTDNSFENRNFHAFPHFFTLAKQANPNLVTASFVSWMPLDEFLTTNENADFRFAHDYEDDGDVILVAEAVRVLQNENPDLTFFYFADVDIAGHNHGFHPSSPQYIAEIQQVDAQIKQLLDAIENRHTYVKEDWLILLSTDHGGTLDGAHGRDEPKHRTIPYIASGHAASRVKIYPTPNVVDIPVTALTHLGINIDPSWGLDGKPSGLRSRTRFGKNIIFNGDAEYSTGTNDASVNLGVPGWIDTGTMTVITYGSPNGYPTSQSPGPVNRGNNFFAGSDKGDCSISQTISVDTLAESIDGVGVKYILSAWLGGFSDQRDMATITAIFLDESEDEIARAIIGPVTLKDRKWEFGGEGEQLTGLLKRETSSTLPRNTRLIRITLESEVGSGANDGFADNISLVLSPVISATPQSLGLDPFYKKYTIASGLPIISSEKVSDQALVVAADLINSMLSKRLDVAKALANLNIRFAVMAEDELTTDIPEHSDLDPKEYWDKRARGLGATISRPVCSCGEENLLGFDGDRYHGESILIHEFAHTIHLGLKQVDPAFDQKIRALFEAAMNKGLWNETYAATNYSEYWAEGVQSWFDSNRESIEPNGIHNHVNTREELIEYDPDLATVIASIFDDWRWENPAAN